MHEYIGNEGESAMCVYACRFGWDKLVTLLFSEKSAIRDLLCFSLSTAWMIWDSMSCFSLREYIPFHWREMCCSGWISDPVVPLCCTYFYLPAGYNSGAFLSETVRQWKCADHCRFLLYCTWIRHLHSSEWNIEFHMAYWSLRRNLSVSIVGGSTFSNIPLLS